MPTIVISAMSAKKTVPMTFCDAEPPVSRPTDAPGKLATMPPKMMIETPLPMPILGDQLTDPDQQHGAGGHRQQDRQRRQEACPR